MEEENNNNKVIIGIIIAIIISIVGLFVVLHFSNNDNKNNNTSTPNNNYRTIEYEKEHVIDIAKMKFIPKDDLLILTDKEIELYYGAEFTFYEIISMNLSGTRILYCFIDENEEVKDLSSENYLKQKLKDSNYGEIKTINIAGFDFAVATLSFEQNGKKYVEDCYAYKVEDKFVCFDYSYLESEKSSFENMIQKVEEKQEDMKLEEK